MDGWMDCILLMSKCFHINKSKSVAGMVGCQDVGYGEPCISGATFYKNRFIPRDTVP
jgi:hypothetical protein